MVGLQIPYFSAQFFAQINVLQDQNIVLGHKELMTFSDVILFFFDYYCIDC